MRFYFLFFLLTCCLPCFGQGTTNAQQRSCGYSTYVETLKEKDATFELRQQKVEQDVQQALQQKPQGQYLQQSTVFVPVVFHVVYSTEEENISDEQIYSQLQILNSDFRRKNADTTNTPAYFKEFSADAGIEFCLASVDPEGNPTKGITRTKTTRTSFSIGSDNVKFSQSGGVDGWDPEQYLNIWICSISNRILGYATPPGASAAYDGVVLLYSAVGAYPANPFASQYNLGRTATHEVGHWLGLNHIWGNGNTCSDSDGIDDTPNQLGENYQCPSSITVSCDDSPYGDMYQNYMDYTDDACMNLFTKGQAAYMQAVLETKRASILNSIVCDGIIRANFKLTNAQDTLAIAGNTVNFTDESDGVRANSWLWEFEGASPATSTAQNPSVVYTTPGKYRVKLTISNSYQTSTEVKEQLVHVTVNELMIYPNPAHDVLTIEQPARIYVRQVELVNSLGQTVLSEQVKDRVLKLDVRSLPPGMYILRLKSTDATTIRKIMITK
ncbi:M43 family zinc metalloprotease [Pontibacter harenae]|uniref:M43 family zinc metalloprotease n=1 Tax=Pontibacter harenae TaxID=2894083 RepID=UPI001E355DE6|nr:M43 family zinc metalloprotease [Pontibacter harenae]MCC9165439.1 T9SS type A sorting domain-containing protein [Pontibacter harenae]